MDGWRIVEASDVLRDGLGVELWDARDDMRVEVFRCDADSSVTATHWGPARVPDDVMEWFFAEAVERLREFEDGTRLPERSAWREVKRG